MDGKVPTDFQGIKELVDFLIENQNDTEGTRKLMEFLAKERSH
jgi:hypothetical protein